VVFLSLAAYYAYNYYNYLNMTRDSDGDGIPDVDELNKYLILTPIVETQIVMA
jgi:hypothetical protein